VLAFFAGLGWPMVLFFLPGYARDWKDKQPDPFLVQAALDQKKAKYPGCQLGHMKCGKAGTCNCYIMRPCHAFVFNRACDLREGKAQ